MRIKDLIKDLSLLDPELEVILSADEEGNSFAALAGVHRQLKVVDKEEPSALYVDIINDDNDLKELQKDFEVTAVPAVVLYPVV